MAQPQIKTVIEKGSEYVQISAGGFKRKVIWLISTSWKEALDWLDNGNTDTLETGGVKMSAGNDKLVLEQAGAKIELDEDGARILREAIRKAVELMPTESVPAPQLEPQQAIVSPRGIATALYSPFMVPVHRETSATCPNCGHHYDLDSKKSLAGKALMCTCNNVLILVDKIE